MTIPQKIGKCFCYPYNYLYVTNNIGNSNIYKYENFSGTNCVFKNEVTMSIGSSGRIVPLNYKKMSRDDDEIIPLGKYPTISWSSDTYINWLTQQAVNVPTQIVTTAMNVAGNIASGNVTGAVTNVASTIANMIGSFYQASLLPSVTHGQNTADINFLANRNTFTYRKLRCKTENMKSIDDYFSCYGYKINQVKIPNITGRTNWNYVKTIDCNIIGKENTEIPQNDINIIRKMFDDGVTLWHNPSTIYDYSQSNAIVS